MRLPVLPARDAVHFPGIVTTLHVVRERSLKAVRAANGRVLVFSQNDMAIEDPDASDLAKIGVVSEVLQAISMPDGALRVALRGLERVEMKSIKLERGAFVASARILTEGTGEFEQTEPLKRLACQKFEAIVRRDKRIPPEALPSVLHAPTASKTFDAIASHLALPSEEKQALLELTDVVDRGSKLLEAMQRELQVLEVADQIERDVEAGLGDAQREYYLREQLRIVQAELERRENRQGEAERYRARANQAGLPGDALSRIEAEIERLDRVPPGTQEGAVLRQYLDTVLDLPWARIERGTTNLAAAKRELDAHHAGLERIKERLLEFVAVRNRVGALASPALCFVGPPGVGKTSFARSLADVMGRPCIRISLGGVRDEAEIRGHRRTYVGAMPGRIISAIRQAAACDPVIVLDEIDKVAGEGRGDPASALLEVLDPEQQAHFTDHFVDLPFDLRAVTFIATANRVDRLPSALRDRLEVIEFPNYTESEKLAIAQDHLWPTAIANHGLKSRDLPFSRTGATTLIRAYTREAGVRELQRIISAICRRRAVGKKIDWTRLEDELGPAPFPVAGKPKPAEIGVATGLVVSEAGGATLTIEALATPPIGRAPELTLTGSLGEVMRESALTALGFVRAGVPEERRGLDMHLHLPEASIPKEGPSAGLAMAVAMRSALLGVPVRAGSAITGEVTLTGRVLGIGGLRDKALAAQRDGATLLVVPKANEGEIARLPAEVSSAMEIVAVEHAEEAFERLL